MGLGQGSLLSTRGSSVLKVIIHPKYDKTTKENDLAILHVNTAPFYKTHFRLFPKKYEAA